MKTIPFLFLFLVFYVQAQLSAKEERIVQKAEKYYECLRNKKCSIINDDD